MNREIRITSDRPLAAFRLIQILNSGPRLAILKILLENKEGGCPCPWIELVWLL